MFQHKRQTLLPQAGWVANQRKLLLVSLQDVSKWCNCKSVLWNLRPCFGELPEDWLERGARQTYPCKSGTVKHRSFQHKTILH